MTGVLDELKEGKLRFQKIEKNHEDLAKAVLPVVEADKRFRWALRIGVSGIILAASAWIWNLITAAMAAAKGAGK